MSHVSCADALSALCRAGVMCPGLLVASSTLWSPQRVKPPQRVFKCLEPEGCHAVERLSAVSGARVIVALARVPTGVVIFALSVRRSGRLCELFHKAVLPRGGQHLAYGALVGHLARPINRLEGTHHVPR